MDLKDVMSTWDQAFKEHNVTSRQQQLLNNFNVQYECNNARDDHFSLMKKKMATAKAAGKSLFPEGFLPYKDKFAKDLNEFDYGSDNDDMDEDRDHIDEPTRPRTQKMRSLAIEIEGILAASKWLELCSGY